MEASLRTAGLERRILDSLTTILFLTAIISPTIDRWLRPDSARSPELHELRKPAPKPALPASAGALTRYPAQFEAHFKDSFGLRDRLLRWNSIVKVFGFGVSPTREIYFGKDGWMFYTGDFAKENHRGALPFSPNALARWALLLERKRAYLESIGCRYLYVIAPDKESVYPELLPEYMRPIGPTRRAQWLEYLKEHAPKVEILDLTEALQAAKSGDTPGDWVYTKLGTHWNGRGAQAALRAVLTRLDQIVGGMDPAALDSYTRQELAGKQADSWSARMYIGDLLPQTVDNFIVPKVRATPRPAIDPVFGDIVQTEIEGSTQPRMILMHDSFGPHIKAALAEQCAFLEAHNGWTIDLANLDLAAPTMFVEMYVERLLNIVDPHQLIPERNWKLQARFEHSSRTLVGLDRTREDWGIIALGDAQVGPAESNPSSRLPLLLKQDSDRLALPSLRPVPGEFPVLHMTIDSAEATELLLFYRPPSAKGFERRCSYRWRLQPGTNDFYIPFNQQGTSGELQLKPGDHLGRYFLREFEIRSIPAF